MPTYSFNSYSLPLVESVAAPMPGRIAQADTPGRAGGYQGKRRTGSRSITVTGTLAADSYADLLDAWSDLCAAHDVEDAAHLVIRDGWYLLAQPETVADSERDTSHLKYDITYRCSDPFFRSTTLTSQTLSTSSSTTFTATGNVAALPAISLTFSGGSGSATITNTTTGETCTISPDTTGTYIIDCEGESVTLSSADKSACFAGQFLTIAPGSNTIAVSATGGTLTAASLTYRGRAL